MAQVTLVARLPGRFTVRWQGASVTRAPVGAQRNRALDFQLIGHLPLGANVAAACVVARQPGAGAHYLRAESGVARAGTGKLNCDGVPQKIFRNAEGSLNFEIDSREEAGRDRTGDTRVDVTLSVI